MDGRRTRPALALMLVALMLVAGACGGYGGGEEQQAESVGDGYGAQPQPAAAEEEAPAEDGGQEEPAETETWVSVSDSPFGPILVDGEGRSLYRFTPDPRGESTCTGDCEANWPVLHSHGSPQAGDGVEPGLLGAVARPDGTEQATIADWPLYYFAGDGAPGETNGQGVGDAWYLVAPDGTLVTTEGSGGY